MSGSIAGPPPPPAVTLGPVPGSVDAGALQHDLDLWNMAEQFFATHLGNVSPALMSAASAVPPWSRAHVALHVAFNAEGIMRLLEWAASGERQDMYPSREWRDQQIEDGVAMTSPADIRDVVNETSVELGEAFAALPGEAWAARVVSSRGEDIAPTDLVWWRTRELFVHAIDLDLGAKARDFPTEVVERTIADIAARWRVTEPGVNFVLAPSDRDEEIVIVDGPGAAQAPVRLTGAAGDLLSYLSGRSAAGVESDAGTLPAPPAWL